MCLDFFATFLKKGSAKNFQTKNINKNKRRRSAKKNLGRAQSLKNINNTRFEKFFERGDGGENFLERKFSPPHI